MRKHENMRAYARLLVMPFMIGVWAMGWSLYWMGQGNGSSRKKPGRLEKWLETVAQGKW